MVADRDAGLLTGAQEDAKELRSELAKTRQRYGRRLLPGMSTIRDGCGSVKLLALRSVMVPWCIRCSLGLGWQSRLLSWVLCMWRTSHERCTHSLACDHASECDAPCEQDGALCRRGAQRRPGS